MVLILAVVSRPSKIFFNLMLELVHQKVFFSLIKDPGLAHMPKKLFLLMTTWLGGCGGNYMFHVGDRI